MVFASKNECFKCHTRKDGTKVGAVAPLHRCTVAPLHRCAAYLVSDSGAGELCEPKLEMAEIMARPAALLRALAWKEVDRRLRSIQRLEGVQESR